MAKTKQDKYLDQIRAMFLINHNESQERLDGLNQFIQEAKENGAEPEMIEALEYDRVNMQKLVQFDIEHPIDEFVLKHLQSQMEDKELTKVLNFLKSDLYNKFIKEVTTAFELNADMVARLIDDGVDKFISGEGKLH